MVLNLKLRLDYMLTFDALLIKKVEPFSAHLKFNIVL